MRMLIVWGLLLSSTSAALCKIAKLLGRGWG